MPFPHCEPLMVGTLRLLVKQFVLTDCPPMALQMFPMLQGEKLVMPAPVEGFMTYWPPAGQLVLERGQHCWFCTVLPSAQVVLSQSCTAPKVWPTSWAMTSHSVSVLTTTLAPETVSLVPS
jgi:hypothetical protein